VLRLSGATYVTAQADSEANAQVIGIVTNVPDVDSFFISQCGYLSGLSGLVAGTRYYLSPTIAGTLTATKPTTATQVVLPLLDADSATTGYFFDDIGVLITGGASFSWNTATVSTSMAINQGYIINGAGTLTMTLPATASPGDIIRIVGYSASGWTIAENAGQIMHFISTNSTVTTGSFSNTVRYDCVDLINVVANTDWVVNGSEGNITIV
jgi:hypothetical protein